jgi:hypothetical protein
MLRGRFTGGKLVASREEGGGFGARPSRPGRAGWGPEEYSDEEGGDSFAVRRRLTTDGFENDCLVPPAPA